MSRTSIVSMCLLTLGLTTGGPALAVDTDKIFDFYCAQCHGLDGKGKGPNVTKDFATSPRNFTDAKEMSKLSDADVKSVILDGGPSVSKSALMPPWSKTLTGDEVDALVKKLRVICKCEGKKG